jgi:glucan biosynthesis protein C
VLFIPLQHYFTLLKTTPYQASYWEFLRGFFLSPKHVLISEGQRYVLPVYGHLWFVLYLLSYTVALCGLLFVARGRFGWVERVVAGALRGPWLLILPLAFCLALRVSLYPMHGFTLRFYDDWYAHAISFSMFLLGFLIAKNERVWDDMARLRWPALAMAAVAFVFYAVMALEHRGVSEPIESANPLMHLVYAVEQWTAIVALLGFGRLHLRRGGKVLRYLNSGVLTYYIVHQAALLLCLYWLAPFGLHPGLEASLIVIFTFTVCFVSYEVVRRVGWLRLFFGQRYHDRKSASWRPQVLAAESAV